jgi:hypothetical protein
MRETLTASGAASAAAGVFPMTLKKGLEESDRRVAAGRRRRIVLF